MSCETPNRPFVVGRDESSRSAFVFKPDCGLWSCEHCAQTKADMWKLTAYYGATKFISEGKSVAFITLTSRGGKGRTREASIAALSKAWPRLRDYARYWQDEIEYLMIPEQHKSGVVHAHLIATNVLTKRWWKDFGHRAGFGYMNDMKPMSEAGYVPSYVAKYLGKDVHRIQWPKGFRRVRASQGWPRVSELAAPEGYEYEVFRDRGAVAWEIYLLRDIGYDVRVSASTGLSDIAPE